MNRKPIFDAVRALLGRAFTQAEVNALDHAIDRAQGAAIADPPAEPVATPPPASTIRTLGMAGTKLIKTWEGCGQRLADGTFAAYPDPGSADGRPWTIGWGSTGPEVKQGVVWTQAQCDARFDIDVVRYVREVAAFLGGAATTPNQFDALVSFHYNTGKIAGSTLGRLHKAGDHAGAAAEFARWIYNDGKPMAGLKNRRADEARLYATP